MTCPAFLYMIPQSENSVQKLSYVNRCLGPSLNFLVFLKADITYRCLLVFYFPLPHQDLCHRKHLFITEWLYALPSQDLEYLCNGLFLSLSPSITSCTFTAIELSTYIQNLLILVFPEIYLSLFENTLENMLSAIYDLLGLHRQPHYIKLLHFQSFPYSSL